MLSLILASSSPYRHDVLRKLGLKFNCYVPDIDESLLIDETPSQLVERLALEKAQVIANNHPESLIIASDQIAILDGKIMTKPHSYGNAVKQLQVSSGQKVIFLTSLCLLNSQTGRKQLIVESYSVKFLDLSNQQIEQYVLKEKPYKCAGSFKSEGLGITLINSLEGKDPNSLIGLPLIALTAMLRNEGIEPLTQNAILA